MTKKIYLAAVSGGPDSMAMLNYYKNEIKVVCHVDYRKRKTSHCDANLVEGYCKRNSIKFEKLIATKDLYNKYYKLSNNFQNIARMIRYDFFTKIASQYRTSCFLLGHNLDDHVETALIQIQKKVITDFLGIRPHSSYRGFTILRPLHNKRKESLIKYCHRNKIPFAIDESNSSDCYERNRYRKQVAKWSTVKFYKFVLYISLRNYWKAIKLRKLPLLINQLNTNVNGFLMYKTEIRRMAIVKFLKQNNISINANKIVLIDDFIKKNSNPAKQLRITNDHYLTKKNNKIILLSKSV